MTQTEFCILNSIYDGSRGRSICKADITLTRALADCQAMNGLISRGLLSESGSLTPAGLEALEPYRVDNAVILAAGASTRFIPLSRSEERR